MISYLSIYREGSLFVVFSFSYHMFYVLGSLVILCCYAACVQQCVNVWPEVDFLCCVCLWCEHSALHLLREKCYTIKLSYFTSFKKNTWSERTWRVSVGGSRPPGGQRGVGEHLLSFQPLCDLAGRDGVLEALPPGQGGTEQAQSFTGACRTLQNPIGLLRERNMLLSLMLPESEQRFTNQRIWLQQHHVNPPGSTSQTSHTAYELLDCF